MAPREPADRKEARERRDRDDRRHHNPSRVNLRQIRRDLVVIVMFVLMLHLLLCVQVRHYINSSST